jgi:hypothetical protein
MKPLIALQALTPGGASYTSPHYLIGAIENLMLAPVMSRLSVIGLTVILTALGAARLRAAESLAPLVLKLPMPTFRSTPPEPLKSPHIEPLSDKPRPPFLAPAGVQNIALHRKVTSSDKNPIAGALSQITDGDKEAIDDAVVELHKNVQWVQIDLEQDYDIYALLLWHDHRYVQVFRSVVVQAADDPDFVRNVRTVFNNDLENAAGLGIGKDKQYFETNQGRLIDTRGLQARYLRCYSKGSNDSALNRYTEIEVYALPAGTFQTAARP